MTENKENTGGQEEDDLPSVFGSWSRIYTIVLGFLFFLIIIFYLMTISLS